MGMYEILTVAREILSPNADDRVVVLLSSLPSQDNESSDFTSTISSFIFSNGRNNLRRGRLFVYLFWRFGLLLLLSRLPLSACVCIYPQSVLTHPLVLDMET